MCDVRRPVCIVASIAFVLHILLSPSFGIIECSSSTICIEKLREGSECVDGTCSNPFAQGCLRQHLDEDHQFYQKRVCNSHDPPNTHDEEVSICNANSFHYQEIRILSQNWESAMFTSWVMQIFLSEMLQVPVSIECGPNCNNNFYDKKNSFTFTGTAYDYDALRTGWQYKDCSLVATRSSEGVEHDNDESYRSCAHVLPEAWHGAKFEIRAAELEGYIEPSEGTGGVGKASWFIPKFLAENNTQLLSYFGLSGERARHVLAEHFLRPTTWKDYCEQVSTSGCIEDDAVAVRPPRTKEEENQYFSHNLYSGHFRATNENDCVNNPHTCTGHIVNALCSWSTFVVPQAHYIGIAVESNGPGVNGGYPYGSMVEILKAANATKSPVLTWWFEPDALINEFAGTYFELQRILLPYPTQQCVDHRVMAKDRCSSNITEQLGSSIGACDFEAHAYQKNIVSNLIETTQSVPESMKSPAYDAIKFFRISDLEITKMFHYWSNRKVDQWNYDPREAVCQWTAENIDFLQAFIPNTYPRQIRPDSVYKQPYYAMAFGIVSLLLVIATIVAVYKLRRKKVMKYAQVDFIFILLGGLFLVAVGAIVATLKPSKGSCIASSWLIVMGYTLELVPLIVKVSAINALVIASKQMKRIKISRRTLFGSVFGIFLLSFIFMTCWTILDPWTHQEEFHLASPGNNGNDDDVGGGIIEVSHFCGSTKDLWVYISLAWQIVLLLCATVLAIQTRKIRSEFNESQQLAFVVYSHFVFIVLRIIVLLLESTLPVHLSAGLRSIIYSFDTIFTIVIYFFPKILGELAPGPRTVSRLGNRKSLLYFFPSHEPSPDKDDDDESNQEISDLSALMEIRAEDLSAKQLKLLLSIRQSDSQRAGSNRQNTSLERIAQSNEDESNEDSGDETTAGATKNDCNGSTSN